MKAGGLKRGAPVSRTDVGNHVLSNNKSVPFFFPVSRLLRPIRPRGRSRSGIFHGSSLRGPYTGYQTRRFPPATFSPDVSVLFLDLQLVNSYALETAFKEFSALERIDCAGGKITFFGFSPYSLASLLSIELHSSE